MNALSLRPILVVFSGLIALSSVNQSSAGTVCYETTECEVVCTVNKKGVLKCNEVCQPVLECEDDGSIPGGTYCYEDMISGEIVCLLE